MMPRSIFAITGTLLLAACVSSAPTASDQTGGNAASQGAALSAQPAVVRTIDIDAKNWAFSPSVILAGRGEQVTVRVHGQEGIHSFAIPDLGINQRVEAGETVEIKIPTDRIGTFSFKCSVPCGAGHRDMKGSITIQP